MIDTILISTNKFSVRNTLRLSVYKGKYLKAYDKNLEYFFTTEEGEVIYALSVSAYYEKFRFRFVSQKRFDSYLTVRFEIPTIYFGQNFNPTTVPQNVSVLQKLKKAMLDLGISAEINDFVITEIHLFKNFNTKYNVEDFKLILNLTKYFSYEALNVFREIGKPDSGITLYKGNKSDKFVLYNKSIQILKKGYYISGLDGENILRFEIRLKNRDKIEKEFKKVKLYPKLNILTNAFLYRKLKALFKLKVKEIFCVNLDLGSALAKDYLIDAEMLREKGVKPQRICFVLMMKYMANEGNVQEFIKIITRGNTQLASNYRKLFREYLQDFPLISQPLLKLYSEIKTKLLSEQKSKIEIKNTHENFHKVTSIFQLHTSEKQVLPDNRRFRILDPRIKYIELVRKLSNERG